MSFVKNPEELKRSTKWLQADTQLIKFKFIYPTECACYLLGQVKALDKSMFKFRPFGTQKRIGRSGAHGRNVMTESGNF